MSLKDAFREAAAERDQIKSSKAVMQQSSNAANTALETTEPEETAEVEIAALTVRVPKKHRVHWLVEAKKNGTSLTAAITEALNARFGEPSEEE